MIDNRFQVGCQYCGHLDSFPTRQRAWDYAFAVLKDHQGCMGNVTVYDSMAHKGQTCIWAVTKQSKGYNHEGASCQTTS